MTDLKTFLIMLVKADKEFSKGYNHLEGNKKEWVINTDNVGVIFSEEGEYLRIDKF